MHASVGNTLTGAEGTCSHSYQNPLFSLNIILILLLAYHEFLHRREGGALNLREGFVLCVYFLFWEPKASWRPNGQCSLVCTIPWVLVICEAHDLHVRSRPGSSAVPCTSSDVEAPCFWRACGASWGQAELGCCQSCEGKMEMPRTGVINWQTAHQDGTALCHSMHAAPYLRHRTLEKLAGITNGCNPLASQLMNQKGPQSCWYNLKILMIYLILSAKSLIVIIYDDHSVHIREKNRAKSMSYSGRSGYKGYYYLWQLWAWLSRFQRSLLSSNPRAQQIPRSHWADGRSTQSLPTVPSHQPVEDGRCRTASLALFGTLDAVTRRSPRRLGFCTMTLCQKSNHHLRQRWANIVCKGPHSGCFQSYGSCCSGLCHCSAKPASQWVNKRDVPIKLRQVWAHKHNSLTAFSVSFC